MVNFNLLLALFWLVLGGALLLWPLLDARAPDLTIWGTGISAGWLALLMAAYNLVRWWSVRSFQAQRRLLEEEMIRRRRESRSSPPSEPDPTFDFTRPPPEGGEK